MAVDKQDNFILFQACYVGGSSDKQHSPVAQTRIMYYNSESDLGFNIALTLFWFYMELNKNKVYQARWLDLGTKL